MPLFLFALVAVGGALFLLFGVPLSPAPTWALRAATGVATLLAVHELVGKPVPFFRWSFVRMMV